MIKKLCVISKYFPRREDPVYAFVGALVEQFADLGVECHVITPISNVEKAHAAEDRVEHTPGGAEIHVWCPRFRIFPDRNVLGYRTFRLTVRSRRKALLDCFRKRVGACDAIYAHFLYSGIDAAWLGAKTGIPAYTAVGESSITMSRLSYETFRKDLYAGLHGVIAVSSVLKKDLRSHDVVSERTPVEVFPNGIDTALFRPADRTACRAALGLPEDAFTVGFVGSFIPRKGFDKLQNVLSRHPDWKCILIGSGELPVTVDRKQIAFSGRLPHDQIPTVLCAADVFALPTLAEGCCNAIVEAMGCGLPIASSDRPFNDDILDESCALRFDPEDEAALEAALVRLAEHAALRHRLAEGAAERGASLSLPNRAKRILSFMEKQQ